MQGKSGCLRCFLPMFLPRFSCRLRHIKKIWMFCIISLTSVVVTVLIYQILFLDGSEFLAKYEDEHRKWNSPKDWPKVLRYKLIKAVNNKTFSSCPVLSIQRKPISTPSATCRLPRVREDACLFAKSVFTTDPMKQACNNSQVVNLCKMENTPGGSHKVECHTTACGSSDIISAGFIDPHDGSISWRHFSFLHDVEKALNNYIQNTASEEYFPFTFLRCDEFWNPVAKTQLFILPPKSAEADKPRDKARDKSININIILIDSVSRPHFYRSLPRTIKAFRDINAKSTRVLDFELFHAIKPRTFESSHALFSGELLETEQFINPVPLRANIMFDKFKTLGYQTLWQEDMCWTYEWGLVRDLKVMNKSTPLMEIWNNLRAVLKNNSIDFTGITHSSCEVLEAFGVPELFHGPSNMCYGGKHYHSFFLQFLKMFLEEVNSDSGKKPLFSFSMLDVGHEDSGLRIQTFDESLASFVKSVAIDPNTLSIILSDHGNTYGSFPRTLEGRLEIFQPHLFIIIPNRVKHVLGKAKTQALIQNQKRLVSIVDLHYTLMAIAAVIGHKTLQQNQGLLQPISRNRSCEELSLLSSTLCICQGWETKVHTNSFHFIIAEFALGKLNEKIQSQYLENSKRNRQVSGFGSCQRLRGERFDNVREKRVGETLTVSLDIYVQHQELFSVVVQVISGSVLLDMALIQYTRYSEYGIYRTCADNGVDLRLCICEQTIDTERNLSAVKSKMHSITKESPTPEWKNYGDIFSSATRADNMHENCLFVLLREHKSGVIFEVANSCSFVLYNITLHLTLSNMQVSERIPLQKEVGPGTIHFLIAVVELDPNINWSWKYTVNFSWKVLS